VVVLGWRFWLLYLWFTLALVSSLTEEDILISIKYLLVITVLLVPLAFLQMTSSPGDIINKQRYSASDDGNVFLLAKDIVRVTGTFTFTLGFTCFVALVMPFAFSNSWNNKKIFTNKKLAILVTIGALFLAMSSGSRAGLIWCGFLLLNFAFIGLLVNRNKSSIFRLISLCCLILVLTFIITFWFEGNVVAYVNRFETASNSEYYLDRILTLFFGEPHVFENFTFLGHGIGLGSNAAALFATGHVALFVTGNSSFILAES